MYRRLPSLREKREKTEGGDVCKQATGSGLFSFVDSVFAQIFGQIVCIMVKIRLC